MRNTIYLLVTFCFLACKKDTEIKTSLNDYIGAYKFIGTVTATITDVGTPYTYTTSLAGYPRTVTGDLLITTATFDKVKINEIYTNTSDINTSYNASLNDVKSQTSGITSLTFTGSDPLYYGTAITTGEVSKISDKEITISRTTTAKPSSSETYIKKMTINAVKI